MATKTTYTVKFRRNREGKTNYKKRLQHLLSEKQRLVIRRSLRVIRIQLISYTPQGDRVNTCVESRMLAKYGWKGSYNSIPAAFLTGLLLAQKAREKGIKECICDLGNASSMPGGVLFAALSGAVTGGLTIPVNNKAFPKQERIEGKHIAEYAKKLKEKNETVYKRQFAQYLKNNTIPEDIPNMFQTVKAKIVGANHG